MLYKVPYQLVGGVRFYSRREVKDVLAILRVIHNPQSNVDFLRVVKNTPLGKGIGDKSVSELESYAAKLGFSLYDAMNRAVMSQTTDDRRRTTEALGTPQFTLPTAKFRTLLATLEELIASRSELPVVGLIDSLLAKSEYHEALQDGTQEGEERWQNVLELRTVAENYADLPPTEALEQFLEDVALLSDVDSLKEEKDAVTLITLHAAKGLEYPVVFIIGMDEGILPHKRSLDEEAEGKEGAIEEERRLDPDERAFALPGRRASRPGDGPRPWNCVPACVVWRQAQHRTRERPQRRGYPGRAGKHLREGIRR
jgi:ATP-dependent DNA helicase UvrD/PcrA